MRLAVVSIGDGIPRDQMRTWGIAGFFRFVADAAEVGILKPDPAIFLAACRAHRAPPTECVVGGRRQSRNWNRGR